MIIAAALKDDASLKDAQLKVLDLFSGIGGFSLGLERTGGFETIAFCEIEEFPRKILAKHWPNVPIANDVRKLSYNRATQELSHDGVIIYVGQIDVVTGGFPCQDLSLAGKQAGIQAARSGLWSEIIRLTCEILPQFTIVENVANMLAGPRYQPGGWFSLVLGDLAKVWYNAEWHCLPAANFNAPHERDRAYVIAYPSQERQPETGQLQSRRSAQRVSGSSQKIILTDHLKERIQRSFQESLPEFAAFSWCKDVRRPSDLRGRSDLPTPLFRGGIDGIPDWVDRIACCGNAVLPQIPEFIGYAIIEYLPGMARKPQKGKTNANS